MVIEQKYTKFYTYIKPILKNRAVKDYAPLVFSLVVSAIFAYFAVKPTLSTIVSLQKALDLQKQTLTEVDKKTESLTLARNNYQQIPSEAINNIKVLLPNYSALPYLIDNLNHIARQKQATVSGLQFQPYDLDGPPQKEESIPKVEFISFTVNLQGDYNDLISILDEFNKASRLIRIQSVSFNKPEQGPLVMSINAKTYYLKY